MAEKERTVRTTVLLPESLYATLKEMAERERRSTHKQIIYALERYAQQTEREEQAEPQPKPARE